MRTRWMVQLSAMCLMFLAIGAVSASADLSGPVEPVGRSPAETGWRAETVTGGADASVGGGVASRWSNDVGDRT